MDSCEFNYLLNPCQREVIADMINELIVQYLGGKEYSELEMSLRDLNETQQLIRSQRNDLGEIFQVKVPK